MEGVDFLPMLIQSAVGGVVAGVAFWATVRTEIKYLRRDVDHAHRRIDKCQQGGISHG